MAHIVQVTTRSKGSGAVQNRRSRAPHFLHAVSICRSEVRIELLVGTYACGRATYAIRLLVDLSARSDRPMPDKTPAGRARLLAGGVEYLGQAGATQVDIATLDWISC